MKINLIGTSKIDFESNGERIKGTKIYVAYQTTNPNLTGMETSSYFLREDFPIPENLKVGQSYDAEFNNKGKLVGLK